MPRRVENYEQAIQFLYGRINYERAGASTFSAQDFKLDRMARLLEFLDHPEQRLPAVHITGTKGKGSTAAMTASMLTAAGYRTGLFTSPHLSRFEERMTVDGSMPTPEQLTELLNQVLKHTEVMDADDGKWHPTYFEIATAMAWLYFVQSEVDIAVLEVGLGGRLDATNLCRPEVTMITNVSRDHTRLLGSKLSQIAREKAGIIKAGVPLISGVHRGAAREVVEEVARARSAPLLQMGRDVRYRYTPCFGDITVETEAPTASRISTVDVEIGDRQWSQIPVPLAGAHQAQNAAMAIAAIDVLTHKGFAIPDQAIRSGMAGVSWPARIEILGERPVILVDAAHNVASTVALIHSIRHGYHARRKHLIFAATRDKDVPGIVRRLFPEFDTVILTRYVNNPRGVPLAELEQLAHGLTERPVHVTTDPAAALSLAQELAEPQDLICVTGSFFIAAEVRELIMGRTTSLTVHDADSAVRGWVAKPENSAAAGIPV